MANKKKLILIVDPQYDFIKGSLKVDMGEVAMNNLSDYLEENKEEYHDKVVTLDWHPINHCSFDTFPQHCLQYTKGASIHQPLVKSLYCTDGLVTILTKGEINNKEEFSVFQNYFSSKTLKRMLETNKYDEIDVCGIAGDICVIETLKDLIKEYPDYRAKISVITDCTASLDGGKILEQFIEDNNLKIKTFAKY